MFRGQNVCQQVLLAVQPTAWLGAVDAADIRPQAKKLHDPFREIAPLRGRDAHHEAGVAQPIQHGGDAGIHRTVINPAHGIAFAIDRQRRVDPVVTKRRQQASQRHRDRRPDRPCKVAGLGGVVAEFVQGVPEAGLDPGPRIGQRSVQIEQNGGGNARLVIRIRHARVFEPDRASRQPWVPATLSFFTLSQSNRRRIPPRI